MENDSVASLSEGQKTCLRLVAKGYSSKEIAIETGLSPQTVDTYIKAAMARLGVQNRREAARLLAQWELSQELGSPPPPVAPTDDGPQTPEPSGAGHGDPPWRLVPVGGGTHDLTWSQKTYAALRVAAVSAAAIVALVLLLAGVLNTF